MRNMRNRLIPFYTKLYTRLYAKVAVLLIAALIGLAGAPGLRAQEKQLEPATGPAVPVAPTTSAAPTSPAIVPTGVQFTPDGRIRLPFPAHFSIQYQNGYKLLTVQTPWPGAPKGFSYVLYPRGTKKPSGVKADQFIQIPVRSVVSFSTTYLPALETLGELKSLVGVDNKDYIYSPAVRALIAQGKVVETTKNYSPDIERLISLNPDVIFSYGVGNEWDTYPKMEEAGLPVVLLADWNENEPLARAEWCVFIAAFFNKEGDALARFQRIQADYNAVKAKVAGASRKPTVLVSGPYNGSWSVSGGGSYMAKLIADAGGSYLWANTPNTGSLTLSVEAVFSQALHADIWLNPNGTATKLSEVLAMDPRFGSIPAFAKGNVWNSTLRLSPGGNDYYESAAMQPQVVLADLAAIFHPELMPGHSFYYYRKLEK